ncbi:Fe-S oxidoreductase [Clostridium tetani]|uniref:radical SAM protein n=1 Tax=Clostridium tetani TaxID=1513 RepID=UPI0005749247|nr:radical SAM protein [Clostridium tetani]KHO39432.1 Fe-S oxidoreductase [Clostridium tetani]
MKNKVKKVLSYSIGEEVGVEPGDIVNSINGEAIKDILDYKFHMGDDFIVLQVQKPCGEIWDIEIEKEFGEDLGIEFEEGIMDEARSCHNNCMFCFIDQLPGGMRKSLYFKDDDSRLSFLQGNFVTLTNMKDEDIDRIIRYRISPINVSVHTTDGELRKKMLNNRFADNIWERLKKLADASITLNCQIVLCPVVNDGDNLRKTVEDLYTLYPSVENIAVVPIGITKYREGLAKFSPYNEDGAKEQLNTVKNLQEKYIKEIGTPFVRLSDEFYVVGKENIPDKDFYQGFDQIEDGVGMIRMLREEFKETLSNLNRNSKGSFTIVTGELAFKEFLTIKDEIKKVNGKIDIGVKKIINNFFGETITVAGLITGSDIKDQLKKEEVKDYILIPRNMLKADEDIFLDDITVKELEEFYDKSIIICEYTGEDFIEILNEYSKEEN